MTVPLSLRTERLLLRRHRPEDVAGFVAFMTDPAATAHMPFTPEQKTPEGARRMIERVIAAYDTAAPIFSLTIADPATDTYLGACGANATEDPAAVEVFYTLLPAHQGRGYATEAMGAIIAVLCQDPSIRCVVAKVMADNVPSVRVAEKLGFRDTGPVSREALPGELGHAAAEGRRYVLECPEPRL